MGAIKGVACPRFLFPKVGNYVNALPNFSTL